MILDLGLTNSALYDGCKIGSVAGRLNLETPVSEAVNIVGDNIARILADFRGDDNSSIILTGPMAVWAYLIVFHTVVHRYTYVYYDDGRNGPILIAQHGV